MSDESLRCRFIVQLLTDYLEDALSSPVHNRVADHLTECDACSAFLDQMRMIMRATGAIDDEQLSPSTRQALLSQFHDWYDEQHQASTNPREAEQELLTRRSARRAS
jgi:predicted anti-sigma-YlaC factor YlaD